MSIQSTDKRQTQTDTQAVDKSDGTTLLRKAQSKGQTPTHTCMIIAGTLSGLRRRAELTTCVQLRVPEGPVQKRVQNILIPFMMHWSMTCLMSCLQGLAEIPDT